MKALLSREEQRVLDAEVEGRCGLKRMEEKPSDATCGGQKIRASVAPQSALCDSTTKRFSSVDVADAYG